MSLIYVRTDRPKKKRPGRPPSKQDGGGAKLEVGQRIVVLDVNEGLREQLSEYDIAQLRQRLGTVIAIDDDHVPIIELDNGITFKGPQMFWSRSYV